MNRALGPSGVRLGRAIPLVIAACLAGAAAAHAASDAPDPGELGRAYEQARAADPAARARALEALLPKVQDAAKHAGDDAARVATRDLLGTVEFDLGHFEEAAGAYADAADADHKGPFADDAEAGEVLALEAAGNHDEAEKAWVRWEKHHPNSPLRGEMTVRRAWHAMRGGKPADALAMLQALVKAEPWRAHEERFALPMALALLENGHADEARQAIADLPATAASTYLRGLVEMHRGSLLAAAAQFQIAAERWPDSPYADAARFAKPDMFLLAGDARSATEDFTRALDVIHDPDLHAEAELRRAGAMFLAQQTDSARIALQEVVARHPDTDVAARAQFLLGEVAVAQDRLNDAIVEYNRVLSRYFRHSVAASAQYRVARCLDQLGRHADATGAYQAVVIGYPLEPQAPAAAYLAGVGLLDQGKPAAAVPYFQLVLDRYTKSAGDSATMVFASPAHRELTEAALCMLEVAYHRVGELGPLSGAPHLLLQRMPESRSPWRAWALLLDADASAAQGRYAEAQATLEKLAAATSDRALGASALRLLAWTQSQQGDDSLAISTEERLVARWGATDDELVSAAVLDIAHERFNQKRYREAAAAYEDFLRRWPTSPQRSLARYQAGLAYLRLDRAGDAVDRWESIVRDSASGPYAERAWSRSGDAYFQAGRYADARRCYEGLLENFPSSHAASIAMLRIAQCAYNAGDDAKALEAFAAVEQKFPESGAAREARRGTELALYRLGQKPDGVKLLGELVERFPGSAFAADAQFQIARRHYDAKRWTDAADAFRQVVSRFPGFSGADQAQYFMGDALAQAGDTLRAKQALEQFSAFFPRSPLAPTVAFRLGLLHFSGGEYAPAAVAFARALEDSAGADVRSAARYDLALCHRMTGMNDEARTDLEKYRSEFPNDSRAADVAFQLGDLDEAAGRDSDAISEFERALALNPPAARVPELAFRIGHLHEQQGDVDGALKAYARAASSPIKDQPFRLSAVARSAALYEAKHDIPRAIAAYRDLVRHAHDQELVAAASGRVTQLESANRR